MDSRLTRKPGLRRDNQSLDASLQGWVDHRREEWAVVDREFIESIRFLSVRVDIGIGSAHKPKHGRRMPLGSKRSEVFARRRRARSSDALHGEVPTKRIDYALGCLRVIHVERIVVQRGDFWGPRRA